MHAYVLIRADYCQQHFDSGRQYYTVLCYVFGAREQSESGHFEVLTCSIDVYMIFIYLVLCTY